MEQMRNLSQNQAQRANTRAETEKKKKKELKRWRIKKPKQNGEVYRIEK